MSESNSEEDLNDNNIKYLSKTKGNNKCIECGKSNPKWISFPLGLFYCSDCVNFSYEVKSMEIDEFSEHEINLIKISGNNRFIKLMKEYKIPMNSENKYKTNIVHYYIDLLKCEVGLIENKKNSKENYQKILNNKPSLEEGSKEYSKKSKENEEEKKELAVVKKREENRELKEDLTTGFNTIGNVFSFFGNSIKSVSKNTVNFIGADKALETIGVNSMLEKTGNAINYFGKETGKIIEGASNKVADIGLVKNIIDKTNSGYSFVKRGSEKIIDGIDSTAEKVIKFIKNDNNDNEDNDDSNDSNDSNSNSNSDNNNNDNNNKEKKIDDINKKISDNNEKIEKENIKENNDNNKNQNEKNEDNNENIDTNDWLEKREFGIDDY